MNKINWQEVVDSHILASRRDKKEKPDNVFSPSMVDGCLRQSTMLKLGLKTFEIDVLRKFMVGTILHKYLQSEASIGHLSRPVEFEKRIAIGVYEDTHGGYIQVPQRDEPIDPEAIVFQGYADAWDGETIYDFKSHSYIEYAKTKPLDKGYKYQLSIYAHALGTEKAEIVFIDKRTLEVHQKEVELVSLTEIVEFCQKVLAAIETYRKDKTLPEPCSCWKCHYEKKELEKQEKIDEVNE